MADYQVQQTEFVMAPSENSVPVPFTILEDAIAEVREGFLFTLNPGAPEYELGSRRTAEITIEDNDRKWVRT